MRTTLAPTAAVASLIVSLLTGCAPKSTAELARDSWPHFGAAGDPTLAPEVALGALADAHGSVVVCGTVDEVCVVKGCWMTLHDADGHELLVRFRDYGFFVPRNASGRRTIVLGTAQVETLSVEALRHLAADAGKSDSAIARITEPETRVVFMADSVWIQGPGLADPYRPVGVEACPEVDGAKH